MIMQHASGAWSPCLVGTLIALLSMATFYFSNKPLSVSAACARLAGVTGNLFSRSHTESLAYYQDTKPKVEWGVTLMFGMLLGNFIAAAAGGEITATWVPALFDAIVGMLGLLVGSYISGWPIAGAGLWPDASDTQDPHGSLNGT